MFKEIKNGDNKMFIDLNEIVGIKIDSYESKGNTSYSVNLLMNLGGYLTIASSLTQDDSESIYKQMNIAIQENKENQDVEKRLKAYINDIDRQVAKEVKHYLDNITK